MYFVRRITGWMRNFGGQMLRPLRNMRGGLARMRSNNPLARGGRWVRTMQQRMGYYTRLPQRYLGISVDDAGGGGNRERDSESARREREGERNPGELFALGGTPELAKTRFRRKRLSPKPPAGHDHMQIHLVDLLDGHHEIVHIGRVAGQSATRVNLNGRRIYFQQAPIDVVPADANVLIKSSADDILVNGESLEGLSVLPEGSTLSVSGRSYLVDLQPDYGFIGKPPFIAAAWQTDVGPVRETNEDAIGVYEGNNLYAYLVADGVGSGYGGDKMSEFVIKYILSAIDMNRRETVDWAEVLEKAAENANIEVRNFLKRLSQKAGTTLTVILIDNWLATVLHIGDSRLYLLRNRVLELLTDDHTGVVPVDDASTEDFIETRVILSRAIGKSNVIKPDIFEVPLEIGDRFILCTDGVTKTVDHEELALIAEDHPLQQMPAHLMQLTHDRRTTDNASVVVIDVASKPEMNSSAKPDKQARVFVANNRRSIRYEKLSRIRNEDLKRQEAPESREEGGFPGCGCLTLTLLVLSLFLIGFWSSGLLVEFLNSQANTATPTPTEVVITETRTPTATFTATGTATSTATVTVTTTSTVTAIPIINSRVTDVPFTVEAVPAIQSQTPVETDSVPDEEVTVSPQPFVTNPVIGTVITVEVVPATQVLNPIATITVRPTNVPR